MPTFLSDTPPGLYLALVVGAAAALVLWYRSQSRGSVVRLMAAAVLLGGLFLIDTLVESPREEAVRRVEALGRALNARRADELARNVSDRFDYHGMKKTEFRSRVVTAAERFSAAVAFKGFDREAVVYPPDGGVRIGFITQISGPGIDVLPYYVEATFGRDPDGEYRLVGFAVYNFAQRTRGPEERAPGL